MALPPSADQSPATKPAGNAPEFTVSELSGAIKRALEDGFDHVRVRGELGRISRPGSGHVYLDLKDDRAVLSAVIWKGTVSRLRVAPEQGMEVIATGRLTTFPGQSKYQLVIEAMEPAGLGALMALLEARKQKFAAEGLFDAARKRRLPFLPRVVGIVTSPTGAVIRDMLHGFAERFPTRVLVWPVRVQGESCAAEVAAAIRGFNALADASPVPRPDVIIVARGGGSLEDLWGFNEEVVVRAAADSRLPLISAVGHETDWTLLDLVADARAPTPTKAAEWAVPKRSELLERLAEHASRLRLGLRRRLEQARSDWRAAARGLPRADTLLAEPRQRFDAVARRLPKALSANTGLSERRFLAIASRLSVRLAAHRIEAGRKRLTLIAGRADNALLRVASARRARLARVSGRLQPTSLRQGFVQQRNRLDGLMGRARLALATLVARRRQALLSEGKLLASLGYQGVLARGYALVRDADGRTVRSAGELPPATLVEIELADGRVGARITGRHMPGDGLPHDPETSEETRSEPARPARRLAPPKQGSLF
ncbi:MAG: exodeoxyribonuclease VII large subunit [Hyphomicrobiaceae bacterium]|nr:exodeoxyribonuclease VII large subunit [Hyphomicrobiaceae bacterium]